MMNTIFFFFFCKSKTSPSPLLPGAAAPDTDPPTIHLHDDFSYTKEERRVVLYSSYFSVTLVVHDDNNSRVRPFKFGPFSDVVYAKKNRHKIRLGQITIDKTCVGNASLVRSTR